ncbi:MAG TPA: vitamin K epoxide reductase family protein [Dermatophilaceae bacterium]|jgi:uncharacterized membrane protein|nr:vitamin K epoxide reductase family protein [Actinomycetales bacterium]HMT32997.1 vitamin K epoxide reductase family protein [Dermatophilaceae bacterium]HMT89691.1 vitamin K epoxide reductase family protein [Dermatophilaceae bacterium]
MAQTSAGNRGAARSGTAYRPERIVPTWVVRACLVICVLGLLVSAYLTWESFSGGATLACPEGETINCAKVTESQWSKLFGIPVAPLGLLFFAGMAWLTRGSALRRSGKGMDQLRLAAVGVGLAMVFYLVWAELFKIGAICLWCTVVHVLTLALFVVLLFGQIMIEPAPARVRYKDRVKG